MCDRCYKRLYKQHALSPRPLKKHRPRKPRPLKAADDYLSKYGNSPDLICPRCETRPVYIRNNGSGFLSPADCCIACRRAEQSLADYWRDDVGLPLAYFNTNMRVTLKPIRKAPIVQSD